jgi:hypothetical protein
MASTFSQSIKMCHSLLITDFDSRRPIHSVLLSWIDVWCPTACVRSLGPLMQLCKCYRLAQTMQPSPNAFLSLTQPLPHVLLRGKRKQAASMKTARRRHEISWPPDDRYAGVAASPAGTRGGRPSSPQWWIRHCLCYLTYFSLACH